MRNLLGKLKAAVILILSLLILFMIGSFINHFIQLKRESSILTPIGTMVDVNNHKLHVYAEGSGVPTLVFMSGGGTSAPVLDFKALYTRLSNQYRTVVIEKAGYGYSETAKISRDIDTLVEESRAALTLAGEKAPYVLFPHSMSGIEALYWAQKYPDEVAAIVGLDPAIPEVYEYYPLPSKFMMGLTTFAARIGITRVFPSIADSSSAIKENHLSEHEKDIYRALFYKNTQSSNMNEEIKMIVENARKVSNGGIPDVPMYFFISNGKDLPLDDWGTYLVSYIDRVKDGKYMILDYGHYIHNEAPDIIAEKSVEFIENMARD